MSQTSSAAHAKSDGSVYRVADPVPQYPCQIGRPQTQVIYLERRDPTTSRLASLARALDASRATAAKAGVTQRTGSFDPGIYRDRYQEALRELIEAKMKRRSIKPREIAMPASVINLTAALKRSLAQEKPVPQRTTAALKAQEGCGRSAPSGFAIARLRRTDAQSGDRRAV